MGKGKKRILILIGLIGLIATLCLLIFRISGWEIIRIRPEIDFSIYFQSCEPPCWLGITPGETDRDTAIELLQESPFVIQDSIEFGENPEHTLTQQWISFELTSGRSGSIGLSNDVVIHIETGDDIFIEEAIEIFGEPDWVINRTSYEYDIYAVDLFYDQGIQLHFFSDSEHESNQINSMGEVYVYPEIDLVYIDLFDPDMFENLQEYFELRFGNDPGFASTLDEIAVPWHGYGFYISLPVN